MALAFGSVFNILTRRFVGADEVEGYDFRKVKERIQGKVRVFWEQMKGKLKGRKAVGSMEREKKVQ